MYKLYLKQQVWSLRDKFAVLNERDQPVYQVVGSVFQIAKHFDILDRSKRVVGSVTKKPLSWQPTFYLEIGGQQVATIQKRFTFFSSRYELSAVGLAVTGDVWDMNFEVARQGQVSGRVAKRWFTVGDKYEITIINEADELLLVGLVIAIAYVKQMQAGAAAANASRY